MRWLKWKLNYVGMSEIRAFHVFVACAIQISSLVNAVMPRIIKYTKLLLANVLVHSIATSDR